MFGVRMAAYAAAYGVTYDFAQFWVQEQAGDCTAVFSKIDGDMTAVLTPGADIEEAGAFLSAVGFSSLLCDEALGRTIAAPSREFGFVMEHTGSVPPDKPCGGKPCGGNPCEGNPCGGTVEQSPSLSDVLCVLNGAQSGWVAVEHGDAWYADVSHRIRHGTAHALLLRAPDGAPAAVVMLTAIRKNAVLMGSVATLPAYRRRGYGSVLIRAYLKELKARGTRVFLLREDGKNEEFYHTLGFSEQGRWCLIKRKEHA